MIDQGKLGPGAAGALLGAEPAVAGVGGRREAGEAELGGLGVGGDGLARFDVRTAGLADGGGQSVGVGRRGSALVAARRSAPYARPGGTRLGSGPVTPRGTARIGPIRDDSCTMTPGDGMLSDLRDASPPLISSRDSIRWTSRPQVGHAGIG